MRSQLREFILWGMADDPVCPFANPSLASSAPAIMRRVFAKDDGPDASWKRRACDLEVERARVDLPGRAEAAGYAEEFSYLFVERAGFGGVAVKERQLVELGSYGALYPAHGVGVQQRLDIFRGRAESPPRIRRDACRKSSAGL